MEQNIISPETLKTEFLSPADCVFSESANGFLQAEIRGETHRRVILTRALPLTTPDRYICVSDADKKEFGILHDVRDFSESQQALIRKELELRYYCPSIERIDSVKEKMGNFYFDVIIGGKKKAFTVKDISKNIRMNGDAVVITDLDGNRYRIDRFDAIPAKSRRKLEPYIY